MSFFFWPPQAQLSGSVDVNLHDAAGNAINNGQQVMADSVPVVIASDQPAFPVAVGGLSYKDSVRNDYSVTPVTTGAWVELIAATAGASKSILLFDSSGSTLELGVGAAASESRVLIIPPGGFGGPIPLLIPAGARLSLRAISANATTGELDLTMLG